MKEQHKKDALNRLKTVRGHVESVIRMVEDERYCPEVMKQVSALQGSLERVNRVLLQNHLETCVTHAITEGRTAEIVEELKETMRYTAAVTGPANPTEQNMNTTTLSVPTISCGHCKSSIEGAVNDLAGVDKVEVHIEERTVDLSFDDSLALDAIIEAIEEQGYDVAR